jgi:hypothetical protein
MDITRHRKNVSTIRLVANASILNFSARATAIAADWPDTGLDVVRPASPYSFALLDFISAGSVRQ